MIITQQDDFIFEEVYFDLTVSSIKAIMTSYQEKTKLSAGVLACGANLCDIAMKIFREHPFLASQIAFIPFAPGAFPEDDWAIGGISGCIVSRGERNR